MMYFFVILETDSSCIFAFHSLLTTNPCLLTLYLQKKKKKGANHKICDIYANIYM